MTTPEVYWYRRVPKDEVDPEVRQAGIDAYRLACGILRLEERPVLSWARPCEKPADGKHWAIPVPQATHFRTRWPIWGEVGGSALEIRIVIGHPEDVVSTVAHELDHVAAMRDAELFRVGAAISPAMRLAAEHRARLLGARTWMAWRHGKRGEGFAVPEWGR